MVVTTYDCERIRRRKTDFLNFIHLLCIGYMVFAFRNEYSCFFSFTCYLFDPLFMSVYDFYV